MTTSKNVAGGQMSVIHDSSSLAAMAMKDDALTPNVYFRNRWHIFKPLIKYAENVVCFNILYTNEVTQQGSLIAIVSLTRDISIEHWKRMYHLWNFINTTLCIYCQIVKFGASSVCALFAVISALGMYRPTLRVHPLCYIIQDFISTTELQLIISAHAILVTNRYVYFRQSVKLIY